MSKGQKPLKKVTKLRQVRNFSDTLKKKVVKDIEEGVYTVLQSSRLYEVSSNSVYKWLYKYSKHYERGTRQVVEMKSEAHKTKRLLEQLAETERAVGQKQMHIDYLEKLIELASAELGVDLKKNFATKSSTSSMDGSSKKDSK